MKIYSGEPLSLFVGIQLTVKYQTQEMQQTLGVIGVSLGEGVPVYNNSLTIYRENRKDFFRSWWSMAEMGNVVIAAVNVRKYNQLELF